VVFAASNAKSALEEFEKLKPASVLIDLHLGDGPTGLDLSRSLRAKAPEVGIVFLTSFESPKLLDKDFSGLPSGSQYLNKRKIESVNEILQAIQRSIAKDRKSALMETEGIADLTPRQLEVLELVAQGATNQEIAKNLFLTPKAVEAILLRVSKKLSLRTDQNLNQRIQMAKAYLRAIGRVLD
jgi:DNA-binding NarL/FixJ family response regulator